MSPRSTNPHADPLWWRREVEWHVDQREWSAAIAAVEEAVAVIEDSWMASYVADALAQGAAAAGARDAELCGRHIGWRCRPTLRRLAGWMAAAGAAWPEVAAQARDDGYEGRTEPPQGQMVRLELLCGDLEAPLARVRFADPAGWWLEPHPAPVVVPVTLWLGARGRSFDEGPVGAALLRAGSALGDVGWSDWLVEVRDREPTWQVDGPALLDVGLAEVERLIDAVVEADARGQYAAAGRLVAAGVDACRLAGRGAAWADAILARHPRRRALTRAIASALGR